MDEKKHEHSQFALFHIYICIFSNIFIIESWEMLMKQMENALVKNNFVSGAVKEGEFVGEMEYLDNLFYVNEVW